MAPHGFTAVCALALLFSGCAATQFVYEHPAEPRVTGEGTVIAAVAPVTDVRGGDKAIDAIYAADPMKDIQVIIQEELMSTGLFDDVILLPSPVKEHEATIVIESSVAKLNWEVPKYKDIVGTAFVVGFLTGGVGGIVYGSTATDVHSDVSLDVRVVEHGSGNVLLEKTYDGHCEEKFPKLKCDTPETKAMMVGKSLKRTMEAMIFDIQKVMSQRSRGTATGSGLEEPAD